MRLPHFCQSTRKILFDNDKLWTMFDRQVDAGKIRHVGISLSSRADPRIQVEKAPDVGESL